MSEDAVGEKNCGRKQNGVHKRVPGGRRRKVSVVPEVNTGDGSMCISANAAFNT